MTLDQAKALHNEAMAKHADVMAARLAAVDTFSQPVEPLKELVAAVVPPELPVTPAPEYRAFIFKTEICPELRNFGFEPRFWRDNLFANAAPRTKEGKQARTLEHVKSYLKNCGAIVALTGDRGVGKTTMVAQLAIERLWQDWQSTFSGGPVLRRVTSYKKLTAIVGKLKALYADFGTIGVEQLEAYREHLASVELLVIDELNECADDSKHKDRILTDILDRRYARKRDSLLLTNQKAKAFQDTTNPSIISRLNEHGGIVPCEWETFR